MQKMHDYQNLYCLENFPNFKQILVHRRNVSEFVHPVRLHSDLMHSEISMI